MELVDCCTSNRRGQVDLQFDIQQSTNGALQSFHTAHSGTYCHIMPNSGTIRFLTGSEFSLTLYVTGAATHVVI